MNTDKIFTSGYRPQTNGQCERWNASMMTSLSMFVSSHQRDWDVHLHAVLFAYRVSPSEVTGESPFYMLYGREPLLPMDTALLPPREMSSSVAEHRARVVENIELTRRISYENTQRVQQKMKELFDHHSVSPPFTVGDKVWVFCPKNRKGLSKKLAHNYHGLFRIVECLSPVHCVLRATDNRRISSTVHVTRLKRYVDPSARPIRQPVDDTDEPYLLESDLPADSFVKEQANPTDSDNVPELVDVTDTDEEDSDGDEEKECLAQKETNTEVDKTLETHEQDLTQDDVFPAEEIVKQRTRAGQREFLIKWLAFPTSHNTWEKAENILDNRLLEAFYKKHPQAKRLTDDPDYNPRIAALSWTENTLKTSVIASISLGRPGNQPAIKDSRQNQPLSTLPAQLTLHDQRNEMSADSHGGLYVRTNESVTTNDSAPVPNRFQPLPVDQDPLHVDDTGILSSHPPDPEVPIVIPRPTPRIRLLSLTTPGHIMRIWFALLLCFGFFGTGSRNDFDSTGRKITFFPTAMMLATNPKALVFYRDTKLVSAHVDLQHTPKGQPPSINSTCDLDLAKFYDRVLSSIRGVQRSTNRLLSMHGVTDLLECDSYLRRYFTYITGSQSTLQC